MEERNIYSDIAQRTNGDIYIGVVGPVRTGKSTFTSVLWIRLLFRISKMSRLVAEQPMNFRNQQQAEPL